jgi:hypothetical protein
MKIRQEFQNILYGAFFARARSCTIPRLKGTGRWRIPGDC